MDAADAAPPFEQETPPVFAQGDEGRAFERGSEQSPQPAARALLEP
jgi:hypothetical protein